MSDKPSCPDCERIWQDAKRAGHRNWRGFACYDCAAFDLDSPEGRALFADIETPSPAQPDLFS